MGKNNRKESIKSNKRVDKKSNRRLSASEEREREEAITRTLFEILDKINDDSDRQYTKDLLKLKDGCDKDDVLGEYIDTDALDLAIVDAIESIEDGSIEEIAVPITKPKRRRKKKPEQSKIAMEDSGKGTNEGVKDA